MFHAVLKGKKFLKDCQYLNYFLCCSNPTYALLVCNILHHYCNIVFLYAHEVCAFERVEG